MKTFLNFIIGGDIAPIGYVLGIFFSVVGFILLANVEEVRHFIGAIILCLIGLVITFFRIRRDVIELRDEVD